MSKVVKTRKEKKSEFFDRLVNYTQTYNNVLIVGADNVRSRQLAQVRKALRGKAQVLMGKNTLFRKVLSTIVADQPEVASLIPVIRGNVGFIFTNENLTVIRDIVVANKVPAPARAGAIAQCDVYVPAGPTGMGPEKTSFFQALGIATKINRGLIDIVSDIHLVKNGEKVDASQADLLQKMNICPFSYGLIVKHVFEDGNMYSASVLDISENDVINQFMAGVRQVASVSLAIDYPTIASVPHSFVNGFKNVLAIAVSTEINFKYAEKVKDMLANPDAYASAAPAAAAAGDAAAAPAAEEPESSSSEVDMGGGGLFGDDDDEEDW